MVFRVLLLDSLEIAVPDPGGVMKYEAEMTSLWQKGGAVLIAEDFIVRITFMATSVKLPLRDVLRGPTYRLLC
jgi:hypothetical protein